MATNGEIEYTEKNIDELFPADYNPRRDLKKDDPEYQKIKSSIENFGLVENLVWNKRTGKLVGGHQRLKILKELGYNKVKVAIVDLDDDREKILNLALNKVQGAWDIQKLDALIFDLSSKADIDATLSGFSKVEIDAIINTDQNFGFQMMDVSNMGDEPVPVDVEGRKDNKNYVVLVSFDGQDRAEAFLLYLGLEPKFKGYTKCVNGETLDFDNDGSP